jgi:hypothetical protein
MNFTVPGLHLREHARCGQQNRDVRVVPARMHDADLVALVLAHRLARKRHVRFFANRQAVHVRAQGHDWSRPSTTKDRDDARLGDPSHGFQTEALQSLNDELRSFDFAVRELGVLMKMPAPLDEIRLNSRRQLVDFRRQRRRL